MTPSLPPHLPIDELIPSVLDALRAGRNAVVLAAPGAGKTTRLPPAVARDPALAGRQRAVVVLQPRRVAARAAAARIAHEQGWTIGEEVGYHIRFDNTCGPHTRVRVLTEGVLTRRIQQDPFLPDIGCVILDEFHERGLHTDLALALLREVQTTVRPDLRIVVLSATLDPAPVAAFLGGAPIFDCPARPHPLDIDYLAHPPSGPIWAVAADEARRALNDTPSGHVLVFLPGIDTIRRACERLVGVEADLHVLHSSVATEEQDRALAPSARRKLILATNIAETSLTIDGVTTVIDSGLERTLVHDGGLGLDRLVTQRISQASAAQRAGRAARTGPGRCLRLWTRAEHAALKPQSRPEIARADLAAAVLALLAYGVRDVEAFAWFDPPPAGATARARKLLRLLQAVDERGALTPLGKALAALPLHPRLGRLLLAGQSCGRSWEAAGLAAMLQLGARAPSAVPPRAATWVGLSDVADRLALFEAAARSGDAFTRERRALHELARRAPHDIGLQLPPEADAERALCRLLLQAYPDRVCRRSSRDPLRAVMVGKRGIALAPSSAVRQGPLFIAVDAQPVQRPATANAPRALEARLASTVELAWLEADFPALIERREVVRYHQALNRVVGRRWLCFAGLLLREYAAGRSVDADVAADALAAALRDELPSIIHAQTATARLLARAAFLRRWMPELELPLWDDAALRDLARDICTGCRARAEVERRDIAGLLLARLTGAQRRALEEHAPEQLIVAGRRVRLDYGDGTTPPLLAIKLQHLFGVERLPRLAAGRAPILVHLLAPNQRVVQITDDLAGFWDRTYAQVRKELRGRYPRHAWPENPRAPQPPAGPKPQGRP